MKVEQVNITDLIFADYNPRAATKKEVEDLKKSLERFGFVEPVVANSEEKRKNIIIGGHFRVQVAKDLGIKKVPVHYIKILDIKKERELNLRLNKNTGRWDWDLLANFDEELLKDTGFEASELDKVFQTYSEKKDNLKRNFGAPPFSILDSRQGYWQERKNNWKALLQDKGESREETLFKYNDGVMCRFFDSIGTTSIFDPVLTEIVYKWFAPKNAEILDVFAGGNTRGLVAGFLGCGYDGIDLRQEQIDLNEAQRERIKNFIKKQPTWFTGDSQDLEKILPKEKQYDLLFTCPPYHDLEQYSDDPKDLSNMNYEEFAKVYTDILQKSVKRLKDNRFAAIVVGDIRDKKGFYRDFVGLTKKAYQDAGLQLYNDMVLINVVGSASLRAALTMKNRKVVKTHQNILIFYKGKDPEQIIENFEKSKEAITMHENVLVFYKGNPKEIQKNYPEIEVDLELDEVVAASLVEESN
jgi:hypothetical protein